VPIIGHFARYEVSHRFFFGPGGLAVGQTPAFFIPKKKERSRIAHNVRSTMSDAANSLLLQSPRMSRFLLIGLDGAEPTLLEPWMDEGRLPNLAAIRNRGCLLPCASTTPPATFPAWTSCTTGVNPGRHGIFDFTAMRDGEYAIRFVNATQRQAPALWNILSAVDKRVAVVGVPGTYPPEEVNGCMVAGFDSPVCTHIDASFVYPPDLYDTVRGWRFADFQESNITDDWHTMALPRLLEGIDAKTGIALDLLRREAWDFFMVVFGESDTVAHHYWMFHDPQSPRHRPGHETAIRDVYERLDATVGQLVQAAGDDVVVGIVSDHGFGGAGTGVVHLNNWLAEQGYLTFAPGRDSVLKKLTLRVVPERMRGALFRRFPGMASRAESQSRFSGIDWSATRAWSEELNYFPSVRVNLTGREPDGQVDPNAYDAFCKQLCTELEAWEPIKKARCRTELYDGPLADRAADIVLEFELENGYSHSCLRQQGGPSFRRIGPDEYLGGKERGMNGNHRPTGVLMLSEPTPAGFARLEDVAPTVLATLGVPAPPMDGTSLLDGGKEGPALAHDRAEQAYTPEQELALERRLRDLGYFE
jgi:predicted AlkP superfamily phosphohydrolase/phosphomutase